MKRICQLYRHFDRDGNLLYVGISFHAFNRLMGHKNAHWFEKIAWIEVENHPDRRSAEAAETLAIRTENPLYNLAQIPIEAMTRDQAQERGLSLVRFEHRKNAIARRNEPTEKIDWAAAKERLAKVKLLRSEHRIRELVEFEKGWLGD